MKKLQQAVILAKGIKPAGGDPEKAKAVWIPDLHKYLTKVRYLFGRG